MFIFLIGPFALIFNHIDVNAFLAERYISFFISIIFFPLSIFIINKIKYGKGQLLIVFIFLILTTLFLINYNSEYLAPFGFICFSSIFFFSFSVFHKYETTKIFLNINLIQKLLWISISLILLMYSIHPKFAFDNQDRLIAFFSSPTTLATWIIYAYILAYKTTYTEKNFAFQNFICLLTITIIVFATKTRINIILIILLVIDYAIPFISTNKTIRKIALSIYILSIFNAYKIYDFIGNFLSFNILTYRYSDHIDTSYNLRSALFNTIYDNLFNFASINQLFAGHGSGASRKVIIEYFNHDLQLHNDILKISYDFGLLFSLVYIIFIIYFSSKYKSTTICAFVYFTSFLHNMIYSHYSIIVIGLTYFTEYSIHRNKSFIKQPSTVLYSFLINNKFI